MLTVIYYKDCDWSRVKTALEAKPEALWSISQMEEKGHMPDVYDLDYDGFEIGTCRLELTLSTVKSYYDTQAVHASYDPLDLEILENINIAVKSADDMGIGVMSQDNYEVLQSKGMFDKNNWCYLTNCN